jgi:hypothetical protein
MTVNYVQVFCCVTWEKPRIISVTKAGIRCPLIFFQISDDNSTAPEEDDDDDGDDNNRNNNLTFYSFICFELLFPLFLRAFLCYCTFVIERRVRKIPKATISFVMSVCPEQLGSHWTDFNEIWYLSIFSRSSTEQSSCINITQE